MCQKTNRGNELHTTIANTLTLPWKARGSKWWKLDATACRLELFNALDARPIALSGKAMVFIGEKGAVYPEINNYLDSQTSCRAANGVQPFCLLGATA